MIRYSQPTRQLHSNHWSSRIKRIEAEESDSKGIGAGDWDFVLVRTTGDPTRRGTKDPDEDSPESLHRTTRRGPGTA